MREPEDMIGGATGVGVVLLDLKRRAVPEQPVKHMGRFGAGRGDDEGMIRSILVRNRGIEPDARIRAIFGVDGGMTTTAASRPKILSV